MANIKIKEEFLQTVVAFGKSGLPLGSRDDLADLAIMAQESGDPVLLQYFDGKLPTVAALKKAKTDAELKAIMPAVDEKLTTKEIIDAAVPPAFNRETRVEELNDKPPSPGANK